MIIKREPYEFGNRERADLARQRDQRGEYRLTGRVQVRVELESVEPGRGQQSRSIRAASTDVSTCGLRLSIGVALPVGALLPIVVSLDEEGEAFALMVEVIWTREVGEGLWGTGARILESSDGDYLAWAIALARAMETD